MANLSLVLVILSCFTSTLLAASTPASNPRTEEDRIIKELLNSNYNPDIRPSNASDPSAPLTVEVNLYIRQVQSIDEVTGTWKTQLTFRQYWTDSRLAFKAPTGLPYLTLPHSKAIWTPDTFFANEIESREHNLWRPNQLIRVFPDGKVLFSSRITLTLSSPALTSSTTATRTTNFRLASYAYTQKDLGYVWQAVEPIQVTGDLSLKDYAFDKLTTGTCNSTTQTGTYSCLKAEFDFIKIVTGTCRA